MTTNKEKIEMLERQLTRLDEMSARAEYAKALSGLTETMLDVMAAIRSFETEPEKVKNENE